VIGRFEVLAKRNNVRFLAKAKKKTSFKKMADVKSLFKKKAGKKKNTLNTAAIPSSGQHMYDIFVLFFSVMSECEWRAFVANFSWSFIFCFSQHSG
jgi:hypothetical protein